MKLNIIDNGASLEEWISSYFEESEMDEQARDILVSSVKRALSKENYLFERVTERPVDAPAWLTEEKFENGGPFHYFNSDNVTSYFRGQINHIRDWIVGASNRGNLTRDFNCLGTLEALSNAADKDMFKENQKLRAKFGKAALEDEENEGNLEVEWEWFNEDDETALETDAPAEMSMVRLLNPTALKNESAMMGHCVGQGSYDDKVESGEIRIYSLRDASNKAHVTIHVDRDKESNRWKVVECNGKENKAPIPKYAAYAHEFIQEKNFLVLHQDAPEIGVIIQDGRLYNFHDLPDDFHLKTSESVLNWEISDKDHISFPTNMTIEFTDEPGNIVMTSINGKTTIPEKLTVINGGYGRETQVCYLMPQRELIIQQGKFSVRDRKHDNSQPLPKMVTCQTLEIGNSHNFQFDSVEIQVNGNANIEAVFSPKGFINNMRITGDLMLEDCRDIDSSPACLHVMQDAHIANGPSASCFYENMIVEGNVYFSSMDPEFMLPETFQVTGKIYFEEDPTIKTRALSCEEAREFLAHVRDLSKAKPRANLDILFIDILSDYPDFDHKDTDSTSEPGTYNYGDYDDCEPH